MPAVSHRNLDVDPYLFSSRNSMLFQKNLQANKPHNICIFIWYFSGPAKDSNPWTLLSRQIIISDNFFIPLGRQSHYDLLVKSGISLSIFQTVYSLLEGLIVQHKPHFLTEC